MLQKSGSSRWHGYPIWISQNKGIGLQQKLNIVSVCITKKSQFSAGISRTFRKKKKIKKKITERLEINNRINKIRDYLSEQEKELIHKSAFVATTVSKATVDKAIYTQRFDVVIFDEASMAYVPQVIFAAGIAKNYFVCLGDFASYLQLYRIRLMID